MATITSLPALAKTSVGANDYLLIANSAVPTNYKFLTQDLFPTVTTLGTTSESLFVSITTKNNLNFKGIKSISNVINVGTVSNNIEIGFDENLVDLANCDNSASRFFSGSIGLTTDVNGTLPVANGGTGLATLTSNSLFVGNGTSALTALGVATNGQIPIGRTGLSPVLANLTAGANITITNGSGAITIAANLSTLTANLDAATYNIFRFSWLSGDGNNEGIAINAAGKVFVGSSTPTAFYTYDLNVNNSIALNGSSIQYISMGSSATPAWLIIEGADASAVNTAGGSIALSAGDGNGTGSGGTSFIAGGHSTVSTGFGGGVALNGGNSLNGNAGTININGGAASGTGGGGGIVLSPGTSTSGTGGKTTINATGTAGPLINFGGTTGAASANSVSSSTAAASAKTGAIRVQINGVDAWIRVYATAE
jgi:hypothetical protein